MKKINTKQLQKARSSAMEVKDLDAKLQLSDKEIAETSNEIHRIRTSSNYPGLKKVQTADERIRSQEMALLEELLDHYKTRCRLLAQLIPD